MKNRERNNNRNMVNNYEQNDNNSNYNGKNNFENNNNNYKYNTENNDNYNNFQRFRPKSIAQAMDILLDKE